MSVFIGLKMDYKSVNIIHRWLRQCACEDGGDIWDFLPVPKQFLYLPIAYSGNSQLTPATVTPYLAGPINIPIKLENPHVRRLGETGNISVVFKSDWITQRYEYWQSIDPNIRFKGYKSKKKKFVPRIPMSHDSYLLDCGWLKTLPIREITLVEEFAVEFDRNAFMKEIKKHYGH